MSSSACASRPIRKKKDSTCRSTTSAGTTFERDRGSLLERALRRPFAFRGLGPRPEKDLRALAHLRISFLFWPNTRAPSPRPPFDVILILTSNKGLSLFLLPALTA